MEMYFFKKSRNPVFKEAVDYLQGPKLLDCSPEVF